MDKYEFIKRLENALDCLSEDEKAEALSYYKELFEDAGGDKAQEIINNLGSPESVAESIIRESGFIASQPSESYSSTDETHTDNTAPQTNSGGRSGLVTILIIALLIVTFPLWIGFVAAAAGILLALVVTVFALVFSVGVAGAVLCGTGLATLFSSFGIGILLLGVGLILIAVGLLLLVPLFKLVIKLCGWVVDGIGKIFRSLFSRKGVVA